MTLGFKCLTWHALHDDYGIVSYPRGELSLYIATGIPHTKLWQLWQLLILLYAGVLGILKLYIKTAL